MDQIIEELNRIIVNAKKSKSRKYTEETLKEKLYLVEQLSRQFGKVVSKLPRSLREGKISEFRILKRKAIETLLEHESTLDTKIPTIMSNFDSKKASDTIPTFDGKPLHLDIFLTMVEMVHDELNDEGKKKLIKYVICMKLNDKVRSLLLTQKLPTTFSELKTSLATNFKHTKTASCLHTELRKMKQKGSVALYRENINSLITELTIIQIKDLGENPNEIAIETIKNMNEKLALETFQEGLNENIRIAVIAAQPKTLTDAYDIAITQERILNTTDALKIFHISNRRQTHFNNHNRKKYTYNTYSNQGNQNFNRQNKNFSYTNHNNHNNNNFNIRNRNFTPTNNSFTGHNRNSSQHNTFNRFNRNFNTNQRNSNIHTIQQQGNDHTLEFQNDTPRREN